MTWVLGSKLESSRREVSYSLSLHSHNLSFPNHQSGYDTEDGLINSFHHKRNTGSCSPTSLQVKVTHLWQTEKSNILLVRKGWKLVSFFPELHESYGNLFHCNGTCNLLPREDSCHCSHALAFLSSLEDSLLHFYILFSLGFWILSSVVGQRVSSISTSLDLGHCWVQTPVTVFIAY